MDILYYAVSSKGTIVEIILNIIATIFLIVGLYLFFVPAKKQSCCKNSKCDCSELKMGNRGNIADDDCNEELKNNN